MIPSIRKLGTATIALAIAFIVNASITAAFADEQISSSQTVLTPTTTFTSYDGAFSYNPSDSSDSSALTDSSTFAPSTLSESFSPSPVPEPSTISLSAMGFLTLAVFVRSKRRSFHANQQTGDAVTGLR